MVTVVMVTVVMVTVVMVVAAGSETENTSEDERLESRYGISWIYLS